MKPPCHRCKGLKGDKWSEEDCLTCVPSLWPVNEDAEKIYLVVQDQYIMSFGGPVALNQPAIHEAMKLYDIVDRRDVFEKVVAVGRDMVAEQREKQAKVKGKR